MEAFSFIPLFILPMSAIRHISNAARNRSKPLVFSNAPTHGESGLQKCTSVLTWLVTLERHPRRSPPAVRCIMIAKTGRTSAGRTQRHTARRREIPRVARNDNVGLEEKSRSLTAFGMTAPTAEMAPQKCALCFHIVANCYFRNSFGLLLLQTARGGTPFCPAASARARREAGSPVANPTQHARRHGFASALLSMRFLKIAGRRQTPSPGRPVARLFRGGAFPISTVSARN